MGDGRRQGGAGRAPGVELAREQGAEVSLGPPRGCRRADRRRDAHGGEPRLLGPLPRQAVDDARAVPVDGGGEGELAVLNLQEQMLALLRPEVLVRLLRGGRRRGSAAMGGGGWRLRPCAVARRTYCKR